MASNMLYEPFESRPFSVPTALQGVCALRCQVSLRGVALHQLRDATRKFVEDVDPLVVPDCRTKLAKVAEVNHVQYGR